MTTPTIDWALDEPSAPKPGLSPEDLARELAECEAYMAEADAKSAAFHAKVADAEERVAIEQEPEPAVEFPRIIRPPELELLEIVPRDPLFILRTTGDTVIAERDYGMIFAKRGVGKTMWDLGKGLALSSGSVFAHLRAVAPRPVLYVEGEMPLHDIRGRIRSFMLGLSQAEREAAAQNFHLLSWELNEDDFPSLADERGWDFINQAVDRVNPAMVVLDNISCLAGSAAENDENAWAPIGRWATSLRKRLSLWWIHHESRGGTARGTSKREDPMDFVINLKQPQGYTAKDGACFEVQWLKARGRTGEAVEPRTFQLHNDKTDRGLICTWNEVSREETTTRALASKLERCIPIVTSLLRQDGSLTQRKMRAAARDRFREEHNEGVSDSIINQAYDAATETVWGRGND